MPEANHMEMHAHSANCKQVIVEISGCEECDKIYINLNIKLDVVWG